MLAKRIRWAGVERLIDYFVHPDFFKDADKLYRVRILIGLLLLFNLVTVAVIILQLTNDFPLLSRIVALTLCTLVNAGFTFLLFKLRRDHHSYFLSSGAAILLIVAAVASGVAFSGGSMESAIGQLLAVPIVMAYFFGGGRRGNQLVVLICVVVAILAALAFAGVSFPRPAGSVELQKTVELLVCFLSIVAIAALAFEYETTAAKLKDERDREHQKAIALAQTDALSGLANRRNFDTLLEQRIAAYGASDHLVRRFALCYIDLDGFKPINDRYGHNVGDEVLRIVAARLQQAVRGSDIVSRQGGDEFTLFIDSSADRADLEAMARRTLHALREPLPTSAGLLELGASLGLAVFPEDGTGAEMLKKAADSAMYEAKRSGGNRWCFHQALQTSAAASKVIDQSSPAVALGQDGHSAEPKSADQEPQVIGAMSADVATPASGFVGRLVESYIHSSLRDGDFNLPRVRIFIMTLLMMFALLSLNCVLMVVIPPPYVSYQSKMLSLLICVPLVMIMYALLERMRHHGSYLACCKAFVLMEFAGILAGISISGGAAASPAAQFFAFPPLTARS